MGLWTTCGTRWRSRKRERWRRSLPDATGNSDWRRGRSRASMTNSLLCELGPESGVSGCAEERGSLGAERERRLRSDLDGIWSFELPVLAEDDDELGAYDGVFGSVSRGRRERRSWRLYGGVLKGRRCVTGEVIAGCFGFQGVKEGGGIWGGRS
jgi:hypothetical protein